MLGGQPEDQLKGPLQDLLRDAGATLGFTVSSVTEAAVKGAGKPDVAAGVGGLTAGYVELKQPGLGADARKFKGRNREQFKKFSSIPNLVYTDGNEWTLYRQGERKASVRFSGDVTADGAGAVSQNDADDLARLLRDFFSWEPLTPRTPRALAEMLAPLCHLLRDDVREALGDENSNLTSLAREWRDYMFPGADDAQFADAYAQTLTYALLLARFSGGGVLDTGAAATALRGRHNLLAQTLRVLADEHAKQEISTGVELLERSISAVDPVEIAKRSPGGDPWLYFYEDFLAAYDRKLRGDRGVYYTPIQVVRAQVNLISSLLRNSFGKPLAFADDGVVAFDPAAGTGTYPLTAIQHGLDLATDHYGAAMAGTTAGKMARNIHAFELLVGPYAVAHLRVTERVVDAGGSLPDDGVHVYLTDAMESPNATPPGQFPLVAKELAAEHERALKVKKDTEVLVCFGNPPYDRQQIDPSEAGVERKGGWVRDGDGENERPLLEDFLDPAREAGAGVHLKNLYNDYVYFWRWALWKVFETRQEPGPGIVSFITASSYLRGPGFVGMREVMRRTFDELWIIDLEGDNLGARKTENVFNIQTPVAIAVGVRNGEAKPEEPARVRYAKITGSRVEKLAALDDVTNFEDLEWRDCFTGWQNPFLPEGDGDYFAWPPLTDVFPWQYSGVQLKRSWPIGVRREVLEERWRKFLEADDRAVAFRETSGRKITGSYETLEGYGDKAEPLAELPIGSPLPNVVRYSFRSFDRQWVLGDTRFADRSRPPLWQAHGDRQVYMTSLLTKVLGIGPAVTLTSEVPDLDHFSGRGGKDVIPLWRDAAATEPNVTGGLLDALSEKYGGPVPAEDLFAYAYAVLASPAYTESFSEELAIPGPRLPITKSAELFRRGAGLGRALIQLHTYGERFAPPGGKSGVPQGRARYEKPIPETPEGYPEDFAYDEDTETLRVGAGEFRPVSQEVWEYQVSGLRVVRSWLGYRMKEPAGRSSSPLDEIRPGRWTGEMTMELLELLWVLEATVEKEPGLAAFL
ncbi:DNA methyltransferase [soil metagenome]